jgi:hypothetical protein
MESAASHIAHPAAINARVPALRGDGLQSAQDQRLAALLCVLLTSAMLPVNGITAVAQSVYTEPTHMKEELPPMRKGPSVPSRNRSYCGGSQALFV